MPRHGENIYKRKDGRWEGRVLRPEGKYQYVYARTYKEVTEKKKNLQDHMRSGMSKNRNAVDNGADLFETWLNGELSNRVKPSTYESYYRCVKKYIIPFYKENGHEKVTAQTVEDFSKRINNNQNLSASYKRKILTIFKTALREFLKGSFEFESVLSAISMPKAVNADVQVFSVREQRMIEKAVTESQDRTSFGILLCFYTGIRLGEVCALKWGDIDFEAGSMSVSRTVSRIKNFKGTGGKTTLSVGAPKSQKSIRIIPLPRFLLDLANEMKMPAFDENCYVLSGAEVPIDPRKYQKYFHKILKKAHVKSRKFHAIRHTFATRALELGVDIKTLSEILGHANVSITLNIYAHSLFEQKKKAIDKLNAMYIMHTEATSSAVSDSVVNA